MPRCFISSIRQYKIGNKKGTKTTKTYDVMITRSGLAIQTMALTTCTRRPPRTSRPPKPRRVSSLKASLSQKSLHHLPLVTRFQLLEREHRIRNSGMDIGIREFIADEKRFEEDMEMDTIAETSKCTYPVVYDHSNGDKQICYKFEEGERLDVFKPSGTNQSSTALYPENEVKYGSEALVLPNSKVIMLTQGNGKGSIMQNSKDGKKPTVIRIVSAKSSRSGYQHEYRKQANPAIVWKRVNGAVVLQVVPQQAVQKPQKHKAYPAANTLLNMAREVSGASCVEDSNKSESDIGSVPSSPGSSICADSLSDDEDDQAASEYQYSCMVDGNGTKIYNCLLCDKIFTLFAAFQSHAATHTRQRNRCPVCKKMFSRSWLLKGHMRTHTGERPYTCPHKGCDRSFADKSNLRSHILIHTVTAKNYICDNCGRAFAQKRYLHKHRLEVCKS